MENYLAIIGSTTAVYIFIIVAIRLFGKKELAQLTVIDLVFILLLSNAVQNAMVGPNTTLLGGLVAAATLFAINTVLKYLIFRFPRFSKVLQGEAIMLVYNGKTIKSNLDKARITMAELEEAAREHGVESIKDVDLAVLEMDGNISILSGYKNNTSYKKKRPKKLRNSE